MATASLGALIVRPKQITSQILERTEGVSRQNVDSIRSLCGHFLLSKMTLVKSKELGERSYERYEKSCQLLIDFFGSETSVADLTVSHFSALRAKLGERYSTPASIAPHIQSIRTIFKFGYDAGTDDTPVRVGPDFRRPNAKHFRRARRERGSQMLEAEEIRRLLDSAKPVMRAMILLGANCGFGNADCGRLPFSALDLEKGWVNFPRPKTEVERRCPLWPETVKAIRLAIKHRPKPKRRGLSDLVFLSKFGGQWSNGDPHAILSRCFPTLLKKAGIADRRKRGFYALRRTFETIGGDTGDQVAVDYLMGHAPNAGDMAAVYRQRFEDHRLVAITEHIRRWLCPDKSQVQIDADLRRKQIAGEINMIWDNLDQLTGNDVEAAITKLGVSQTELARGIGYGLDWVNTLICNRPNRHGKVGIGADADLRFRMFMYQLSEGKEPIPLAQDDLRPSFAGPQDFPLSDDAVRALNRHPFTPSELRVVVDCLKASGVLQAKLATWWGYTHKFLRAMLCGEKQIPFMAANRLRELFGLSKVEIERPTIVVTETIKVVNVVRREAVYLGRLPLTPEVRSALEARVFTVSNLQVVLNYLRSLRLDLRAIDRGLGLPLDYLSAAEHGHRKNLCQGLLRRLFAFEKERGAA